MANKGELLIKPLSWTVVKDSLGKFSGFVELFGYTSTQRSIYVKIACKSTYVLSFPEDVNSGTIFELTVLFNPTSIRRSETNPKLLSIRASPLLDIPQRHTRWNDIKKDPYGELESLWETKRISPYEWINIHHYRPLANPVSRCDLNVRVEEIDIVSSPFCSITLPPSRLFFWEYEMVEGAISMISIITPERETFGNYIIKNVPGAKGVAHSIHSSYSGTYTLISCGGEEILLKQFFSTLMIFNPDYLIQYDSSRTVAFLERLAGKIPLISKINSRTPYWNGEELVIAGVESVSVRNFIEKWYSHLETYDIDSAMSLLPSCGGATCPSFTGETTDRFFEKSHRVPELWYLLKVFDKMMVVCEDLRINLHTLLHKNFSEIISRVVFKIETGTVYNTKQSTLNKDVVRNYVNGIYLNASLYDYSKLYLKIMATSHDAITMVLVDRLYGAPPELILAGFESPYVKVSSESLNTSLLNILDNTEIESDGSHVIAVDKTTIWSTLELNSRKLEKLTSVLCYVMLGRGKYIILDRESNLLVSPLLKSNILAFPAFFNILKGYLETISAGHKWSGFDIHEVDQEDLLITQSVGSVDAVTASLSLDGKEVKYIMTVDGPSRTGTIDLEFYQEEIEVFLSPLYDLPVLDHRLPE